MKTARQTTSWLRRQGARGSRAVTRSGSRQEPDLADDEIAADLERGPRAPGGAEPPRPRESTALEAYGQGWTQVDHDIAPGDSARPAGAQCLARRLLGRDGEGDRARARDGGPGQPRRLFRPHELGHQAFAPAFQGSRD